jgi:hypothetical protein
MEPLVYFVPMVDMTWAAFAPLDARKSYSTGPLPMELCAEEAAQSVDFMYNLVRDHFVYALHTGTYCRDGFYKDPFMQTWQRAASLGAEILVHPHEEIAGVGTRYGEREHMLNVTKAGIRLLREAGIEPVGYRGGHYAYANFMTALLEELGLKLDFSGAPGVNQAGWEATWGSAPFSAYHLCREEKNHFRCEHTPSSVIEVPLGADGKGGDNRNLLYIDNAETDLVTLTSIWDVIAGRASATGQPQVIHTLYHTISMSSVEMKERFERFLAYALAHGGATLKPSQVPAKLAELGVA